MALAGNFIPGMLFGWLYWRRGLEAAMIAHALAHLLSTAALALLVEGRGAMFMMFHSNEQRKPWLHRRPPPCCSRWASGRWC